MDKPQLSPTFTDNPATPLSPTAQTLDQLVAQYGRRTVKKMIRNGELLFCGYDSCGEETYEEN